MAVSTVVLLVVVVGAVLYVIGIHNRLVVLRNRFKNGFAQIEVQLKRRHDLIPNLVETARAYMAHERDTLEAVISARNQAVAGLAAAARQAGDEQSMAQLGNAEGALNAAMGRLNVTLEAYPDLKASQTMQQLSEELISTENKVAYARQAYNDAVMEYNAYKQSFPPVFFAPQFGHKLDAGLLQFADSASIQAAPRVAF